MSDTTPKKASKVAAISEKIDPRDATISELTHRLREREMDCVDLIAQVEKLTAECREKDRAIKALSR